jgi:hypothetical protein
MSVMRGLLDAMRWLCLPLIAVFVACSGTEDDEALVPLDRTAVDEVAQSFRDSSFAARYDVQMSDAEGGDQSVDLAMSKVGSKLLIEMRLRDYGDELVYTITDVATGTFEIACGVRTLETGEEVCLVQEDQAWTLVFFPLFPVVAVLGQPDATELSSSISQGEDSSIEAIDSRCYTLYPGQEDEIRFCVGDGGEALHQSRRFEDDVAEFTASDVRHEVTDADVQIPYRVVYQADEPDIVE